MSAKYGATQNINRRSALWGGVSGLVLTGAEALANESFKLPFASGPRTRAVVSDFPQKGEMILQRSRPPLLETPFEVFDKGVFTPNNQFYVRWHWSDIPTSVDINTFKLAVHGHVEKPLSLSIADILALPHVEMAAVNHCSGNSRGFFAPRVAGGEWANGAMGNARWTGVRLSDILKQAGVKAGAVQVRMHGLDVPVVETAPQFKKSLGIDHAMDGEVMVAFAMNGEQLPLLNGFPLRVVVPGWYATYWVKMLSDLEVLDKPDDNFWMKVAYTIPDTPHADMKPGQADVKMVPINKMVPRSFITNLKAGDALKASKTQALRGIAFGGDTDVKRVEVSTDDGRTWMTAQLGKSEGKYSFRRWEAETALPTAGTYVLKVRCTNANGLVQPDQPNWNPAGFMRNVVEAMPITVI